MNKKHIVRKFVFVLLLVMLSSAVVNAAAPVRVKTETPIVFDIDAGDRAVEGRAETNALIRVYDGNGYIINTGYAFSGRFSIPTRELVDNEIIQVYAHANLKDESDRVLVYVGRIVTPAPDISSIPEVEPITTNTALIRGKTAPRSLVEIYDQQGYFLTSVKSDEAGNFVIPIRKLVGGEILQFYVTEPNKVKTPQPLKVTVINRDTYSIDIDMITRNTISGRLNRAGYVTVNDRNGNILAAGSTNDRGEFLLAMSRNLVNGEGLTFYAGNQPYSTSYSQGVVVEVAMEKTARPSVVQPKSIDALISGTSSPNATIIIRDGNNIEIARGSANAQGNFSLKLNRPLLNNEPLKITAQEIGKAVSDEVPVIVESVVQTARPFITTPKSGQWEVTGSTVAYAKINVVDGSGNVLGFNWAGPSGRFTVSLRRNLEAGDVLSITAQAENQAESAPVGVIVEQDREILNRIAYINGYPTGEIRPGANLTRAEAAAMFGRLLHGSDNFSTSKNTAFSDADNKWYSNAINYVVWEGYMRGYPDGTFLPENNITRAEFAQMISKYDVSNDSVSNFSDTRGHWAKGAIDQAYGNGRIKGYPDGTFKPNAPITRAEAVTILNSLFNRRTDSQSFVETNYYHLINRFTDLDIQHWAYYELTDAANSHKSFRRDNSGFENWTEITNK